MNGAFTKNRQRHFGIAVAMATGVALFLGATGAEAAKTPRRSKLRSSWVDKPFSAQANQSYFAETSLPEGESVMDDLFDPKTSSKMRQEYDDMTRTYEARANYDLADQATQESYMARLSRFTSYVLRRVLNFRIERTLDTAKKNSKEVRTFEKVQKTVKSVVQGSVNLDLDESLKLGTKTDIPGKSGQIWMKSGLVDGALDVSFKDQPLLAPGEVEATPVETDRFKVSLQRKLPLKVDSSVTYGINSTRMTAQVSKSLLPHLTCEVATVHGFDAAKSGLGASGEETVRFNYKIRF